METTKVNEAEAEAPSTATEAKRRVYVIDPPNPTDGGAYLLFVHKNNPFSGGSSSIFAVDRCVTITDNAGRAVAIQGLRSVAGGDLLITEFPLGTSYLLVHRSTVRSMTFKELRAEEAEDRRDFEEDSGDPGTGPGVQQHPGQYI